jgi:hypothetical protein
VENEQTAEEPGVSIGHRIVRRLARYSYAISTFYHVLRQRDTSDRLTNLYRSDSAAWQDAKSSLDGLIDICRESDIELIVFLYGDFSARFSGAFRAAYSSFLIERGVPVRIFPEEIYDRRYRNSVVDGHPNPTAHRLIAEEILGAVEPLM